MQIERADDPIPESVTDALRIWDDGLSLFSVEMGGMGPGYEMAIQGLAFELMRAWKNHEWTDDKKQLEFLNALGDPIISKCDKKPWGGFSGAQVGAAKSLAAIVCKRGYRKALRDEEIKDRLIQVCKRDLRGDQIYPDKEEREMKENG